jgi:ABC-type multidrug transport system ATPase subunit
LNTVFFDTPAASATSSTVQNLRLHAELYGVASELVAPRMRQMLEMVGLWERRDAPVRTFSGGMRRRLEIARGLMHSPRVLFLDEPTIGLDPQTRASIWSYIRLLRETEEITIFMTTHYMDEAEFCDRIAIMDQGEVVALDAPAALKAAIGADRIRIQTDDDEAAMAELAERFDVEAQVSEGAVTFFVASGEEFVPRLVRGPRRADPLDQPVAPDARRRVHVLHRLDDPRRRGVRRAREQPDNHASDARRPAMSAAAPAEVVRVRVPPRSFRSELRAIRIVWRRELIRFASDRTRIITSLVQPLLSSSCWARACSSSRGRARTASTSGRSSSASASAARPWRACRGSS